MLRCKLLFWNGATVLSSFQDLGVSGSLIAKGLSTVLKLSLSPIYPLIIHNKTFAV